MKTLRHFALSIATLAALTACASTPNASASAWPATKAGEVTPRPANMPDVLARNLATFDDLDFRVYTQQDWKDLHMSHATNIVVHYPDGHTTTGLPDHVKELDFMWTFAPDNRITLHPIRFGTTDGEWTAVAGFIEGTFTKPMVLADGTTLQPTGKAYKLPMATLGHWNKDGQMSEEFLYWDNAALMKQIGVGN
ncbi:ester cyclase [Stenotrophomonas sp. NPDC077659]|uniref:ester cyclase n=1 Tax=Stenotrophomonas sp. NPDC077659 TaxID=3390694 RepID=UPI003D009A7C